MTGTETFDIDAVVEGAQRLETAAATDSVAAGIVGAGKAVAPIVMRHIDIDGWDSAGRALIVAGSLLAQTGKPEHCRPAGGIAFAGAELVRRAREVAAFTAELEGGPPVA